MSSEDIRKPSTQEDRKDMASSEKSKKINSAAGPSSPCTTGRSADDKYGEFIWTVDNEVLFLTAMIGHKPVGINRHFEMVCIVDNLQAVLNRPVDPKVLWDRLDTMYNMERLNRLERIPFPNDEIDFSLPEEYYSLMQAKQQDIDLKMEVTPPPETVLESPKRELKRELQVYKGMKDIKREANKELPVKEKDVIKPVKEKDVIKPVKEKDVIKPVKEKDVIKPVKEKDVIKPVKEKDVTKQAKEKDVIKPVKEKDVIKPVKEKEVAKPPKEKDAAKPVKEKDVPKPESIVEVKETKKDEPELPDSTPHKKTHPSTQAEKLDRRTKEFKLLEAMKQGILAKDKKLNPEKDVKTPTSKSRSSTGKKETKEDKTELKKERIKELTPGGTKRSTRGSITDSASNKSASPITTGQKRKRTQP